MKKVANGTKPITKKLHAVPNIEPPADEPHKVSINRVDLVSLLVPGEPCVAIDKIAPLALEYVADELDAVLESLEDVDGIIPVQNHLYRVASRARATLLVLEQLVRAEKEAAE